MILLVTDVGPNEVGGLRAAPARREIIWCEPVDATWDRVRVRVRWRWEGGAWKRSRNWVPTLDPELLHHRYRAL